MKVSELITALQPLPQDLDVFIAFDQFCGGGDVSDDAILIVEEGQQTDRWSAGVYLSDSAEDAEWALRRDEDRAPGRILAPAAIFHHHV